MRYVLIIYILIVPFIISAQTYIQMLGNNTSAWHVGVPDFSGPKVTWSSVDQFNAEEDSIVSSNAYKKLYKDFSNTHRFIGLIREDTVNRKVYFIPRDSTQENILYDFSLTPRDSFLFKFRSQLPTGWYNLKNIDTVNILGNTLKRFIYESLIPNVNRTIELWEGIGLSNEYLFCDIDSSKENETKFLACAMQNKHLKYEIYDACGIVSGTKQLRTPKFMLYAYRQRNYVSLYIDFVHSGFFEIRIDDFSGRNLFHQTKEYGEGLNEFNFNSSSELFILRIISQNQFFFQKLQLTTK
jgi:hypothetical protein